MIFNRHKFVEQAVRLGFKNSIKTIGYKSVEQFNRGCKTNCVTARFKHEELAAPQTLS